MHALSLQQRWKLQGRRPSCSVAVWRCGTLALAAVQVERALLTSARLSNAARGRWHRWQQVWKALLS